MTRNAIFKYKWADGRWDMVGYYREIGRTVWADHCPNCGKYARCIAGDHSVRDKIHESEPEPWGPWYRTDCRKCGVWEVVLEWKPRWLPKDGWPRKIDPSNTPKRVDN